MLKLAKKSLVSGIFIGLLLAALAFFVLISTQKNYKADLDLLVVQNQTGMADYYAMSRSADYLTNIITEAVYSEKFLDEVLATGKITRTFLPGGTAEKLKEWQKTVSVKKNSSVGIVNIKVFAESENQAHEITGAVSDVLINKNSLFLGKGQDLEIRVLSGPIIEKNPSIAQIALAAFAGFLAGIFLVFINALYRSQMEAFEEKNIYRGRFELGAKPNEESDYWKEELEKMRA